MPGPSSSTSIDTRFATLVSRRTAGIKDVGIAVGVNHKLDQHWIVSLDAQVARLTGDAANSPIVFSKTEATFLSALKYHF
jgi:outer membrane scaffolding protein for murein synthesis (MipA/OmpV family)